MRWSVVVGASLLVAGAVGGSSAGRADVAAPAAAAAVAAMPAPAVAIAPDGAGYRLPLAGEPLVLTPFRAPPQPWAAGHRGVDLAAPAGAAVLAAGAGRVVYAGDLAGRGVVSVEHAGGLRTTYEPVTSSVRAGQQVRAGDQLGLLQPGHPSCAPADCLHWGARLGETYLDPMTLLAPLRVRLLPWDG